MEIVRVVVAIAATEAVAAATLGLAVLVRWLQRAGLELAAERQARLEKTAQDVVLGVEEWAAALARRGARPDSAGKLEVAVTRLRMRLPALTTEEARTLVHEALPRLGLGATDALRRTAHG